MNYLSYKQLCDVIEQHIHVVYDHSKADHTFNCKLDGVGKAAEGIMHLESSLQARHIGWWVMVKQTDDGGWECLGFVNEDADEEELETWWENMPPFDVILPIPDPKDERLGEWDGF